MLRSIVRLVAVAVALACAPLFAQDYPTRPIKIIVPFAAGGPADVYARFIGVRLQEALGQPVVVEDRPGAGSIIGTDAVAKSAPDGYTLLMMSNTHTVNETLIPNKPYQLMRDFVPVAPVNYSDLVLVVHPSGGRQQRSPSSSGSPRRVPASSTTRRPAPARRTTWPASSSRRWRRRHRARPVQGELGRAHRRPRRAGADDVRRGADDERAREERPRQGARHDRQDALVGAARVPTIAEAGVPGYEAVIWLGLMAPKGTPPAIVSKLNAEIAKIQNRPEVRQEWASQGALPMMMTPDEFGRYLNDDIVKWERIVKISGAKADQ